VKVFSRIASCQSLAWRENRLNRNSRILVILPCLLWSFFGCDDSPSFEAENTDRAINQSNYWTSENGRGGYEWKLNQQGQFTIPIPPVFPFLTELASQPKQMTLWPNKAAKHEPWDRPTWMSDEVHEIFRRFTEPAAKRVLLQLPAKQISHNLAFDLSRNGETLVTLNDGKIELYHLNPSGPPQSFPCPLKDAYGVLTTSSKSKFYLCNSKSIALVDISDIKAPIKKEDLSYAINFWEKATESDALLAVSTDDKMTVFDGDLNLMDRCSALEDSSVLSACLNFNGKYVLASFPNAIFHWSPGDLNASFIHWLPQSSVTDETKRQNSRVIAGGQFDCHWDGVSVNLIRKIRKSSAETGSDMLSISSTPHHLAELNIRSFEPSFGSFLVHAKQKVAEGNTSEYLVFDFATPISSSYLGKNGRFRRSKPISVGLEPIKRLIVDRSGQTLVTFGQSGLSVLKRTPWTGPPDASVCYELAKTLLASGDFDQLERCAQELRKHDWPEYGLWGEQVYACFVQQVGLGASESKFDTAMQERLTGWHETGSDLALLSRAFHPDYSHHWLDMRRFAEGNVAGLILRPEYISGSLESFEARVNQVLEGPHPPALAFFIKYYFLQLRAKSISELGPILKRCIELYPNQLDLHKHAVMRMLSASNQNSLPAQAYIKAIASSFSKELVDEATVLMMSEFSPEQWRVVFASDAWTKEQEQVERTVTKWIRDNEQNKIETFFQGQPELKKCLRKTGIDQYYEATFPFGL
jgi:hypothetical protein